MNIGSLFSGVGGLELGLERAGLGRTTWQVEKSAFCRDVLAAHWPDAVRFNDVRTVGAANLERVGLICGGFPCQNLSSANTSTRTGLAGEQSGLWREFARVIDELRPVVVVVENVFSAWRRWVPVVRGEVGRLGYASVPVQLRACDVGAPHDRSRCFVVCYAYSHRESALRFNAEASRLRESSGLHRQNWGRPTPRAMGVADGVPCRVDRNAAIGNAVVPAMAEVIGRLVSASL